MIEQEKKDKIILDTSNQAFHAFGYAYIFDLRIKWYIRYINAIKFLGIIIPLMIGALVIGYGVNNNILLIAVWIATPILILQLFLSTISAFYKWDDELVYSFETNHDYNSLYDELSKLHKFPPTDLTELERKYEVLITKIKAREQQNAKHKIKDKERRIGMRYSLREHKIQCVGCNKIPTDMKSSNCGVCGNF